ncbi:hypothetical protein [Mycobacterium avium]|uniref:hypothetical protein n=1 Tax=Mycobacterium avium TaxID=1764 RepID=UPI0009FD4C8F|nr:hypothetical protein [Mycobacterium avium]
MTLLWLGDDPGGTPDTAGPGDGANPIEATLILPATGGQGLPIAWPIQDLLADGGVISVDWQCGRTALTEVERNTGSALLGRRAKLVDAVGMSAAVQI